MKFQLLISCWIIDPRERERSWIIDSLKHSRVYHTLILKPFVNLRNMTSSVILRRSSSVIPRCFFAALASVEPLPRRFPADRYGVSNDGSWTIHTKPRPLNFCTSVVPRAVQFTVERDYSNYEEVSGANSDEGLEIMNLRIAPQIVDALAKKGVVKLFPIQVTSICCVH